MSDREVRYVQNDDSDDLGGLFGAMATPAEPADYKDYPDRWRCAYSYNAGGRAVWVYGDTIQWKPMRSPRRAAPAGPDRNCVSLGCFRRL